MKIRVLVEQASSSGDPEFHCTALLLPAGRTQLLLPTAVPTSTMCFFPSDFQLRNINLSRLTCLTAHILLIVKSSVSPRIVWHFEASIFIIFWWFILLCNYDRSSRNIILTRLNNLKVEMLKHLDCPEPGLQSVTLEPPRIHSLCTFSKWKDDLW